MSQRLVRYQRVVEAVDDLICTSASLRDGVDPAGHGGCDGWASKDFGKVLGVEDLGEFGPGSSGCGSAEDGRGAGGGAEAMLELCARRGRGAGRSSRCWRRGRGRPRAPAGVDEDEQHLSPRMSRVCQMSHSAACTIDYDQVDQTEPSHTLIDLTEL